TLPQVRTCALLSLRAVATAGLSALALCPPALAQDDTAAPAEAQADTREIAFEATAVSYDSDADTVTAEGDVLLRSGDQSVRADTVSWNRTTGEIVAMGSIRFVDEDGNQLFTDRLELTDELRAGAMTNLLLAFRQGGRLAAVRGERDTAGNAVLEQAAYSACAVEDAEGCPKTPSWRITADRVFYDAQAKTIRFRGAYFELFGARVLPLPGLALRSDGAANSGFMVPDLGLTTSNGLEIGGTYYWRMAPNRDLSVTGTVFTEADPMVSAQYRELGERGAIQITGYLTHGSRIPLNAETP